MLLNTAPVGAFFPTLQMVYRSYLMEDTCTFPPGENNTTALGVGVHRLVCRVQQMYPPSSSKQGWESCTYFLCTFCTGNELFMRTTAIGRKPLTWPLCWHQSHFLMLFHYQTHHLALIFTVFLTVGVSCLYTGMRENVLCMCHMPTPSFTFLRVKGHQAVLHANKGGKKKKTDRGAGVIQTFFKF